MMGPGESCYVAMMILLCGNVRRFNSLVHKVFPFPPRGHPARARSDLVRGEWSGRSGAASLTPPRPPVSKRKIFRCRFRPGPTDLSAATTRPALIGWLDHSPTSYGSVLCMGIFRRRGEPANLKNRSPLESLWAAQGRKGSSSSSDMARSVPWAGPVPAGQ